MRVGIYQRRVDASLPIATKILCEVKKMKHIKLMADYICYPLWELGDPDYMGDIDPRCLPLPKATILRLDHWAAVFDDILVWDDSASSGFKTKEEEDAWDQEGVLLWKELQQKLGPAYQVDFFFHGDVFASFAAFEQAYPGQYQAQESPYSPETFQERILKWIWNDIDPDHKPYVWNPSKE